MAKWRAKISGTSVQANDDPRFVAGPSNSIRYIPHIEFIAGGESFLLQFDSEFAKGATASAITRRCLEKLGFVELGNGKKATQKKRPVQAVRPKA